MKDVAMNYFERLLARAVAIPANAMRGALDDPFERIAWDSEASAATTVQREVVHDEQSWQAIPSHSVFAVEPETAVPAGGAVTPTAVMETHEQSSESRLIQPSTTAMDAHVKAQSALYASVPPAICVEHTYLNQDDLLSNADAFMQGLALPEASAGEPPIARMPTGIADATIPAKPVIAPAVVRDDSSAHQAQTRLQPPAPQPAVTSSPMQMPSAPVSSPDQKPAQQTTSVKQTPEAPQLHTVIAISPTTSVAAQYARQLGAMARFGIGQL